MDSESRAGRLSDEDRALIRRIGGQLSQLIHGMPAEIPDIHRRDELGLLANMVSRIARELTAARAAAEADAAELQRRVTELQNAYETQEKLLARVRELSYPIMALHPEVLLVPIAGALVLSGFVDIVEPLLHRLAATRARAVIIDITRVEIFDEEAARSLVKIERATRARGAVPVLAGLPVGAEEATGIDLSALNPCADLAQALTMALDFTGYRIVR
ncbi:MAG: STAS domain-containing protein [Byssovorax sp.]